jgi:hypothetical protein
VRLLLDEMYPAALAELLRDRGHDVVAVVEVAELVGRPDGDVVRWAHEHERAVVTENVVDYAGLEPGAHGGLVLVNSRRWPRTRSRIPRLADALGALLTTHPAQQGPVAWL